MRARVAIYVLTSCLAASAACGVDERLLSQCATAKDGGPSEGSGGTSSDLDGSSSGGIPTRPDGSASGGKGSGGTPSDGGGSGGASGSGGAAPCGDCMGNIVVNADFDANVDGWDAEQNGAISWDEADADNAEGSGSISVSNNHSENLDYATAVGARQCARVTPGKTYELSAKVMIRVTEGSGAGHLSVSFHAGNDCDGGSLPNGFTTSSGSRIGDWEHDSGTTTAPPGAGSMAIRLIAVKPLRQDTLSVVFDDVRVLER